MTGPATVRLARWAERLYRESVAAPPLGVELLAMEQLEAHARSLAREHALGPLKNDHRLMRRLADSERVIARCHELLMVAHAAGCALSPAAEWLLDNHGLVEEQIALARQHFPRGYSRRLPRLAGGEMAGQPRVYDLIRQFVARVDGRVDAEALGLYTAAYQSVTDLDLGELWSVAIMLRLSLIENLRRVAVSLAWQRVHRDAALAWARRIDAPADRHESTVLVLAEMVRENLPLSPAFVAEFSRALQGRGATTTFVLAWLEQRLAERGHRIEAVVRAEGQMQAANQAAMANSIASLRLVNGLAWHVFVETHSRVERILRAEPAGVYAHMDFATRDTYRHVVEGLSRRLSLEEAAVATAAVACAATRYATHPDDMGAHVGHVLVDAGRPAFERALRALPALVPTLESPPVVRRRFRLAAYLLPVAALSALGVYLLDRAAGAPALVGGVALTVAAVLASSQAALAMVNWLSSLLMHPRALPRMDFERGIPDASRTIVVVPTLLTAPDRVAAILEGLELRYLANRDPNLWFGLLTDFCDAPEAHAPDDDTLLDAAAAGIEALNARYGPERHGKFFLFHRPRMHNPREGCWMGRERKRGKLEDFNALLCGDGGLGFSRIVGERESLAGVRYVITLDTDTDLPWGAGWRLVGAAAHPLNRPTVDAESRRLVCGYAILQPRVGVSVRSAAQSRYAQLLAGDVGFDPYTRVVSDVHQDLFAETSFVGKGIYDVGAFRQLLHGRFPDNAVLSHDLLESCYARSAQCSDVELLEDTPSGYLADVSRRHRWMRGDWQIAPWLGLRVSDATGRRIYPALAPLGWWKIFDNLRRALVAPAYTLLLALGWLVSPTPGRFTLAALALVYLPEILPGLAELSRRPPKMPYRHHLGGVARATGRRLLRLTLWVGFLPFEGYIALDAAGRSLWRMFFTRRRLLEWQTAAAVEAAAARGLAATARRMWVGPTAALVLAGVVGVFGAPTALPAAAVVLLAWLLSPLVAHVVSRPLPGPVMRLSGEDVGFLRRVARLTWRYFEVFVGPQENWLPPDNFQARPDHRVAHRTSPTDMGLSLLANLTAFDLGYLSGAQLVERTERIVDSMDTLERHRGHFYNWYDTVTRRPLRPLYVSSVDSGNLVGHVRVLAAGLDALGDAPVLSERVGAGLADTLAVLGTLVERTPAFDALARAIDAAPDTLSAQAPWLAGLASGAESVLGDPEARLSEEAAWWANALARQIQALRLEIAEFAPCLSLPVDLRGAAWHRCVAALDACVTLRTLADASARAADASVGTPEAAAEPALFDALRLGAARASVRLRALTVLSERCVALATADFSFLYDPDRMLFSIGFWVNERRLDASQYDLLASESRLASFVAIADGQVPFDHWFALGRRLTTALGRPVLLSWSGSMFEYLMPLLVMPGYRGTLLDVSCEAAVSRQIDYGRRRGVAWGISESCYDLVDAEGTYQYRAFGVPGLGLQRGLAEDLVVAPYATVLALLVDPAQACANLQRLAAEDCLGPYGFYEAVDHTGPRRTLGRRGSVIPTVMVHHQGMSLLALARTVLGPRMQARFLSVPEYRAAALLLQERVPAESVFSHPHALEAERSLRAPVDALPAAERTFTHPNTPVPEVHLLSNGRYQVMVSAAGGGYSRWGELALTRWREDPTSEAHGVFFYVSDLGSHRTWSNTFQPMLRVGRRPTAIFTTGRAEFRREDEHIETHTEIAVSNEDDVEVRRLRLQNRSTVTRTLVVTAFAEIVLAPGVTDELHRAFSNLFVQAEVLNEHGAILFTRRARSDDEQPAWMFCLLSASGEAVGPCSATADRATFVGRGRSTRQPAALEGTHALDGTDGAVLDPCAALRRRVTLTPDRSERLDLVIGAAATREAAFALMMKYKDHRMADRVFEGAATHGRVALNELGITETLARCYERLAAAVLFPVRACRAPASVLRRNRKTQAGLWAHGISGDLPIVLLRMSRTEHLDVALDLLRAHAFWRTRGLAVDLVIWNEELSGYRNELDDLLIGLLSRGPEAALIDRPGGVFLRHLDGFDEDDRVLLASVARIVVRDIDGPLEGQLEHWWRTMQISRASLLPPPPVETPLPMVVSPRAETAHRADLRFANGHGGFTQDGREYIVDLSASHPTPAPWCNVIANERIGMVVSERGSACTWVGNAQLHRLTPWHNDAVGDPSGESLFLRDEATGRFFSPLPGAGGGPYTCRHGFGYSVFEHRADELETRTTTYVHVDAPVKFVAVRVRNVSGRARRLSVFAAFELVLGDLRSRTAMHVVTEVEPLTGALLAQNAYGAEPAGALAFLDCSEAERSVSGDRVEWAGRNGDPACPAALRLRHLSGRVGAGFDPCLAMQARLDVPAGEDREVVFILGAGVDAGETMALLRRHRGVVAARLALEGVWAAWNERLEGMHATTPDPALDVLFNGWLPYQILASRMWGRAGFHQSGGAYGFRDQLQDTTALLHMAPALARAHLLRCAARQFVEGDVQHWWHPGSGRGVRTRCVDDALWLPYAVHRYVTVTGDTGVLDERVAFLTGRGLEPGEESRYDLPGAAEGAESLYEHCVRALGALSRLGEHGLPLMGSGDWNDGMNRVGPLGRGESVWMGFFGCEVLGHFATLAEARSDAATAVRCRASAVGLAESLERHAWDGAWYRRAWFDDGTVLGTGGGEACEVDSLPQSWATLAGVGSEERRGRALDAIWDWLVASEAGVIKLFTPPFDGAGPSAGYIGGYPRGVRENGGQYTHAALWAVMAFAKAGRGMQAERMLELINPVRHTLDGAGVARYRAEPYVIAADVYGEAPHAGRAGWTWYTGSAAWMYRLVHEVFFGLDRQGDTLHLDPRPPASWNTFTLNYRFGATRYRLDFVRAASADGRCRLMLDGEPRDGQRLGLVDDGQAHVVEVRFGDSPGVDGASGRIGLGSVSI